jgi:hypothetical protein
VEYIDVCGILLLICVEIVHTAITVNIDIARRIKCLVALAVAVARNTRSAVARLHI